MVRRNRIKKSPVLAKNWNHFADMLREDLFEDEPFLSWWYRRVA